MNWKAIKHIYCNVLVNKNKIEYLGGDRYKITRHYINGNKNRETEYQNGELHGKSIGWYENGNKHWETEYQNGELHGKSIGWYENGNKRWETEHQNGKEIK